MWQEIKMTQTHLKGIIIVGYIPLSKDKKHHKSRVKVKLPVSSWNEEKSETTNTFQKKNE